MVHYWPSKNHVKNVNANLLSEDCEIEHLLQIV